MYMYIFRVLRNIRQRFFFIVLIAIVDLATVYFIQIRVHMCHSCMSVCVYAIEVCRMLPRISWNDLFNRPSKG